MISLSIGSQHTARFRCAVAVCFTVQRTESSGALAGMPKRGQYTDFGLLVLSMVTTSGAALAGSL